MKIETTRNELLSPVQAVIRATERKRLPILSCIQINAGEESTRFTATDLQITLKTSRPIAAKVPGSYALPAHRLRDILAALPEDAAVTLTVEPNANVAGDEAGGRATLRSGRSRFVLTALPGDSFPVAPDHDPAATITVSQQTLKTALNRTAYAMAKDDVRYYLNGLLMEVVNGNVRVAATDGHRMAVNVLHGAQHTVGDTETLQVIIPADSVDVIRKLLADIDEPVSVLISEKSASITCGDTQLTTALIEGKFPDYQRIIPTRHSKIVVADKELVRGVISRTKLLLTDKTHGVELVFEPWVLKATSRNSDRDEAEDEAEVNYDGPSFKAGFNAFYLLNALDGIDGAMVKISAESAQDTIMLENAEGDSGQHVIMSMRI